MWRLHLKIDSFLIWKKRGGWLKSPNKTNRGCNSCNFWLSILYTKVKYLGFLNIYGNDLNTSGAFTIHNYLWDIFTSIRNHYHGMHGNTYVMLVEQGNQGVHQLHWGVFGLIGCYEQWPSWHGAGMDHMPCIPVLSVRILLMQKWLVLIGQVGMVTVLLVGWIPLTWVYIQPYPCGFLVGNM